MTPVPEADVERGDGDFVIATIETFCRVTKDGYGARGGDLFVLRPVQKRLIREMFARRPDGRMRHRTCLVGMPRKNAKSGLGSGLALDGLLFGGQGSDVFSCAGDRKQAGIIYDEVRKMVEADEELKSKLKTFRDFIEASETGSVYRALSSEAFTKEGLNPKRVLFDEVHVQPNRELWDVMDLAMAARLDPMMIGVTTAGVRTDTSGRNSLCYGLYLHGIDVAKRKVDDPSFYMAWWGAPEGADHRDPAVWAAANPLFGDLIDPEDFAAKANTTPENEFRTKRLNQWVASATAWMPAGAWDDCDVGGEIEDGTSVVLGFDGSFSNDSTALIVASVGRAPLLDVVDIWERPTPDDETFRVSTDLVEQAIIDACQRWHVLEVVCDPHMWRRTMEHLESEGLPMVEYPQGDDRMIPATQRFYQATMGKIMRHTGNPVLARHVGNAHTILKPRGARLAKDRKGSQRKIDAAVAAVMAYDRASILEPDAGDATGGLLF